jgi:predicted small metal-binding protein
MKTFSCGAVVPGCSASFEAPSDEEILAQVAEHARADHGLTQIPDELVTQVCAQIQTVAA